MIDRDIEKLTAINYEVGLANSNPRYYHRFPLSMDWSGRHNAMTGMTWWVKTESEAWEKCKAHAQSPEGMKATMADKVQALPRLLGDIGELRLMHHGGGVPWPWEATWTTNGQTVQAFGPTTEAAVNVLFWEIP